MMYNELLWIFLQLPDNYVVLDTETTGLPDENGLPDIITLGITRVKDREIVDAIEFSIRPRQNISKEAESVHGISNQQASLFETFESQWPKIEDYLNNQLVVIHNASFDWPILLDHVRRYALQQPKVKGLFCSQKAATPWAQAKNLECSHRGPSLNVLTKILHAEDLRARTNGIHGAKVDSQQTALVVEELKRMASK